MEVFVGNDSHFNQDDMSSYESSSQQFGSVSEPNMCDVMDSLRFNYEDIRMPWDADGNITAFGEIIGTPDAYTQFWQPQTTGFTSAVVAQRGMVEAFTGEDISEAQLLYEATTNGWLTDAGMSPMDAGNLLELHGIDCHVQMEGATVEDLISELSQGHKVLVGVDSGELLDQDYPLEDFFHQSADRAIWVTGIDTGDPDHPKIIINDSGDPLGAGKEYDLSKFVNAWKDSGFSYVATDNAPAGFHLAGSGFDPVNGCITGHCYILYQHLYPFAGFLTAQGNIRDIQIVK
jgi:hypothetical protein